MRDIKDIKSEVNIVDVIGRYVSLTKKGTEFHGLCPFHDDTSASLQVNERKQIFKCFPCAAGGDVFDFLKQLGKTLPESIQELSGGYSAQSVPTKRTAKKKKAVNEWTYQKPTRPPSEEELRHYDHGNPSAKWLYRDSDGHPVGYAVRFDLPNGGKEVLPFIYATNGTIYQWVYRGIPRPRPMYGLELLKKYPKASVLMVEGEKCADFARSLLSPERVIVLSWMGGAQGVKHTDFSPLSGRRCILWPDNDVEGLSAMLHIAHLNRYVKYKMLPISEERPKKWDVADGEWTAESLQAYIMDNMSDLPALDVIYTAKQPGQESVYEFGIKAGEWSYSKHESPPAPEPVNKTPEAPPKEAPKSPPPKAEELPRQDAEYFRFCGYGKNESGTQAFFFYVYRSDQIVKLSASAMTKTNLLALAPLDYWEAYFPAMKAKYDIETAQNFLIGKSIEAGIYDPASTRGRGAWIDGDDVVIHAGGGLVVNGKGRKFHEYKTSYTYERGRDLHIRVDRPATNKEARSLIDLTTMLSWDNPINAYLLAGWCAIAPVCGALNWRPHIWITGPAGTGKSWIFKNIVQKMLAKVSLSVQGETTEAGIRQFLGGDALPVIFDEAEGEDRKAQQRIQSVLTLMRGSSTSEGGMILKGSAGGGHVEYSIRSCFVFASIGVQLSQASDKSRVSVLSLKKNQGEESEAQWENLQSVYHRIMTDSFPERIQARTISLLPSILRNAETFASAAATVFGDQRAGDQIGTLLAGAFSLTSSKEMQYSEALKWIRSKDWGEVNAEDEKDERRLINLLMERITMLEIEGTGKRVERTIGELVKVCAEPGLYSVGDITEEIAEPRLNRLGFRVDKIKEILIVSNTSNEIRRMLQETPWARNHAGILKRLNGAQAYAPTTFGGFTKSRAVAIPLNTIFD